MPIVVLIQASEDNNFTININEGDDIYYKSIFPPWAINRVEITGLGNKVVFDDDSQKCERLTSNVSKFKLDNKTLKVEKRLDSKTEVIIRGKIPNPFIGTINVNFLRASLQWNYTLSVAVFQLNITNNSICIGSYTNGRWINLEKNRSIYFGHQDLENGKRIKLNLTFPTSLKLLYILETKEDVIEREVANLEKDVSDELIEIIYPEST
uniref:Galectin n=1 Tax=Meloidogyne floridensis TaxID=298350 RepID=A0A915NV23_9BILA